MTSKTLKARQKVKGRSITRSQELHSQNKEMQTNIFTCLCILFRKRERDTHIYIYICIYIERERHMWRKRVTLRSMHWMPGWSGTNRCLWRTHPEKRKQTITNNENKKSRDKRLALSFSLTLSVKSLEQLHCSWELLSRFLPVVKKQRYNTHFVH